MTEKGHGFLLSLVPNLCGRANKQVCHGGDDTGEHSLYTSVLLPHSPWSEDEHVCVGLEKRSGMSINKVYSSNSVGVCGGLGHAAPPVPPAVRGFQQTFGRALLRDFCTCDLLLKGCESLGCG